MAGNAHKELVYNEQEIKAANAVKKEIKDSNDIITNVLTEEMAGRFSEAVSSYASALEVNENFDAYKQFSANLAHLADQIAHTMGRKEHEAFKSKLRPLLNGVYETFSDEKALIVKNVFEKLFLSYGLSEHKKNAQSEQTKRDVADILVAENN